MVGKKIEVIFPSDAGVQFNLNWNYVKSNSGIYLPSGYELADKIYILSLGDGIIIFIDVDNDIFEKACPDEWKNQKYKLLSEESSSITIKV